MGEIIRSKGTTKSENYLAQLADRTFLNLWSYPNLYRDAIVNRKLAGRELCDLLVVCGNHVIIFSVKEIKWPENKNINEAWIFWYKKAIEESIKQVRGAERWIANNPERIFLDTACTQSLPIKLPPIDDRKVHSIVVALGAHDACSKFFLGDSGSFMINPQILNDSHFNPLFSEFSPFVIGDVNTLGSFIHVVNDVTLDILMKELDTITDFISYLESKANFLRSGKLGIAAGEEELLAYYLTHMVDRDHHGFSHPKNQVWNPRDNLALDQGHYTGLIQNPQYIAKKEADKISYVWDSLIKAFTNNMLAGTTITSEGVEFDLTKHEVGVRHMAQEPRYIRRMLGSGIMGLLKVANQKDRNFRSMIPVLEKPNDRIAYAFMTLAYPEMELPGGYDQYRKVRSNMLTTYCFGILERYPHVEKIIGIATEPMLDTDNLNGFSEDMVIVEQPTEWTKELKSSLALDLKTFDIMREENLVMSSIGVDEYPEVHVPLKSPKISELYQGLNRHQRRAAAAKARRRKH